MSDIENAEARLAYVKGCKTVFTKALEEVINRSPWILDAGAVIHAKGCMSDVIDDLFYKASQDDRDLVESHECSDYLAMTKELSSVEA